MTACRRGAAGWLLLASLVLVVAASAVGNPVNPGHAVGPRVFAAMLLLLIWRGGTWSRGPLIVLSTVSAGFALALVFVIALGAPGINTMALAMFALYAGSGGLLRRTGCGSSTHGQALAKNSSALPSGSVKLNALP